MMIFLSSYLFIPLKRFCNRISFTIQTQWNISPCKTTTKDYEIFRQKGTLSLLIRDHVGAGVPANQVREHN